MELQIAKIKETCLYVADLEVTKNFYHDKLGLPVIALVKNNHVFFRAGSSVLLCFIAETAKKKKQLPPHYGQGHLHFAFEVSSEQYEAWKEKVQKAGIKIEQEVTWKPEVHSFYFRDPDGHLAEMITGSLWE